MRCFTTYFALAAMLLGAGVAEGVTLSGDTATPGVLGDGNPTVVYESSTGSLVLFTEGNPVNHWVFNSAAGIFTGAAPIFPGTSFFNIDNDFTIAQTIFTPTFTGAHNFGPVAQSGLTEAFLLNDLSLIGNLLGEPNDPLDLIVVSQLAEIPEPSGVVLVGLGLVALLAWRQRRWAT